MNFIYDVLLNFNDQLYDFYEWDNDDNVAHIRKIPLFRVSTNSLEKIKKYNIKVDFGFIKKIENRTEVFTSRDVEKINYAALFTDLNDVIALKFDENGNELGISKLLLDEAEEVSEIANRCNEMKIIFETLKEKNKNNFKTRREIEKINYLNKSLNKLEKNKELEKLKYLYFECFNEKQESIEMIISKLKQAINNEKDFKTMYDFFKLISIN